MQNMIAFYNEVLLVVYFAEADHASLKQGIFVGNHVNTLKGLST
jgi:hypothetical protein